MLRSCVHDHNTLASLAKCLKACRDLFEDSRHESRSHPRRFLAQQDDLCRLTGSAGLQFGHFEQIVIADPDLWKRCLQGSVGGTQADEGGTTALLPCAGSRPWFLVACWPPASLNDQARASVRPLDGRLVQINEADLFPESCGLVLHEIEPAKQGRNLQKRSNGSRTNDPHRRPKTPKPQNPKTPYFYSCVEKVILKCIF